MNKNRKQTEMNPLGFETEEGIDVTKRVQNGITVVFTNYHEAVEYARTIRSYLYEIFSYNRRDKWGRTEFYGWAVPK